MKHMIGLEYSMTYYVKLKMNATSWPTLKDRYILPSSLYHIKGKLSNI